MQMFLNVAMLEEVKGQLREELEHDMKEQIKRTTKPLFHQVKKISTNQDTDNRDMKLLARYPMPQAELVYRSK